MRNATNVLARALRGFFSDHLPRVRGLSPHTVMSYRDSIALLLRFLAPRHERTIVELNLDHIDPKSLIAFLDHLESERGNCASTRNSRLAAVHAFARYVATQHPECIEMCQRLLAVPFKRTCARVVEYLESNEIGAMLEATDQRTRYGRRDYALLLSLFNTGARVQELLDLRPVDLQLERPFQVRLFGKGRKERLCPLWPRTVEVLRMLVTETKLDISSSAPLFRNRRGKPLTRFGVRYILKKYAVRACSSAPSLARKRVHPHTLRHTAAVHLLQAGVDLVTISHWLGHASVETTNRYTAIDLETKRAAVEKANPVANIDGAALTPWRSDASVLEWLEAL
ncbi:MAG: site-specific integrase [bacterium]|nr:site-specific integrase [bacterium]